MDTLLSAKEKLQATKLRDGLSLDTLEERLCTRAEDDRDGDTMMRDSTGTKKPRGPQLSNLELIYQNAKYDHIEPYRDSIRPKPELRNLLLAGGVVCNRDLPVKKSRILFMQGLLKN